MIAALVAVLAVVGPADTLQVARARSAPRFDGVASAAEYGAPLVSLATGQGHADIWVVRDGAAIVIAAHLPDSTFYWGDDFVVSLDPRGDAAETPAGDDIQWYIRRTADSSVVSRGRHGRWGAPNDDPDWRLGAAREGEGWALRTVSDAAGWSVELRVDDGWFAGENGVLPQIAFRTYDDAPHGWWSWPAARPGEPGHVVERAPRRWVVIRAGVR